MLEDDPKSLFLTYTAFRALEKATDIGVVPRPAERAHRHDSDNDRHWQSRMVPTLHPSVATSADSDE